MKPIKPGTEQLAFSGYEALDRARAKVRELRAQGIKGVTRRTDQIEHQMIYVVSWPLSEEENLILKQVEETINVLDEQSGNSVSVGNNQPVESVNQESR